MKNDAKNWLAISVILNAILGGLLTSIVFESEFTGIIVMILVFLFSAIMVRIANYHHE